MTIKGKPDYVPPQSQTKTDPQFLRNAAGLPVQTSDPQLAEQYSGLGAKAIGQAEAEQGVKASKDLSYVDQNWGTAGTLGMGALSGLTLGMGPGALAAGGYLDPGHLEAAQTSPWYTAGDVAGTIAPAMASGGIMGLTPAGLMTSAGSLSERVAGGLFAESGLTGRMGSMPLKMAARGATEGALINMGHAIGDNLIQNKPLAAEAIASAGLDGALFGGLIGGTLGTVGAIGSRAVEGMGSLGKGVLGGSRGHGLILGELGMDAEAAGSRAGGVKGTLREAGEILEKGGSSIGDSTTGKLAGVKKALAADVAVREEAINELAAQAPTMQPNIERLQKRVHTDVLLARVGTPTEARAAKAVADWEAEFFNKSQEKFTAKVPSEALPDTPPEYALEYKRGSAKVGSKPGEYVPKEVAPAIKGETLPGYENTYGFTEHTAHDWKSLVAARDHLAESIKGTSHNPLLADTNTIRREILNALDSEIVSSMEGAGKLLPDLKGVAEKYIASTQSIKLAQELEANLGAKASKAIMSSGPSVTGRDLAWALTGSSLGHPAAAISFLAGKGIGRQLQGRLEPWMAQMAYNNSFGAKAASATQSMQNKIGESLKAYFKAATKAPSKAAMVSKSEGPKSSAAAKSKSDRKSFEEMATRAEQLLSANHQDKVKRYIESMNAAGYTQLAEAMMAVNQRAVQYLTWTTPPRQATKAINSLRKMPVSKVPTLEEYRHKRQTEGIMRGPLGLLEDLKDGKVSRDQVNAVAFVYPESVNFIAETFAQEVVAMKERGDFMPMDKITNLGVALNAPIDRTLEGDYVAAVQTALNAPPADKPEESHEAQSGVKIGQTGQALMTPLQTISFQA